MHPLRSFSGQSRPRDNSLHTRTSPTCSQCSEGCSTTSSAAAARRSTSCTRENPVSTTALAPSTGRQRLLRTIDDLVAPAPIKALTSTWLAEVPSDHAGNLAAIHLERPSALAAHLREQLKQATAGLSDEDKAASIGARRPDAHVPEGLVTFKTETGAR